MLRENITDLMSFVVVAREQSFTRAAAQLRVSQSALSHAIRGLEERLQMRLLHRTTRRVSLTEVGEQLLLTLEPRLDEIENGLYALSDMRNKPAGSLRITTAEHAATTVVWPKLAQFLPDYPEIKVEVCIENGFVDIIAERFDAGIRLGESIAQDMVAVRVSPDIQIAVVGSPEYFSSHPIPIEPNDLAGHKCINLRMMSKGGIYSWEFAKQERIINVAVEGQLIFNSTSQIICAAEQHFGLGYAPLDLVANKLQQGTLVRVLEDWSPCFPGYFLYYPSRRQHNRAFALFIDAMRHA